MQSPSINLTRINEASEAEALSELRKCCGSIGWCRTMVRQRPFESVEDFHVTADRVFDLLDRPQWLEAFGSHPKIGDLKSLRMKFAGNDRWSGGEQAGINDAEEQTLQRLAELNREYEQRFGYIFIVCASGKTAVEMLAALRRRIDNQSDAEFSIACGEQRKITHLRIDKLLHHE